MALSARSHRAAAGAVAFFLACSGPAGATDPLNVNTAGVRDLDRLPGIGPRRAEAIVAFRDAHGPFPSPASLGAVPGISPKLAAQIRPHIVIGPAAPVTSE